MLADIIDIFTVDANYIEAGYEVLSFLNYLDNISELSCFKAMAVCNFS
jgi:hypothetical protein